MPPRHQQLTKRPQKKFREEEEIPGTKLPVVHVSTYENAINFEPAAKAITEAGIYWVRIRGGGVSEGYLVELF